MLTARTLDLNLVRAALRVMLSDDDSRFARLDEAERSTAE